MRAPASLAILESELAAAYPTLHVVSGPERVLIKGAFPVWNGGEVLDWYEVEIGLALDHPSTLPRVREVGGRIPWILDRHVLPDGSACVVLPDAYWLANPTGRLSIFEYLAGPVRDFFLGQSIVELGDPWPQGEWAHGAKGLIQHYATALDVDSAAGIGRLLIATIRPLKGHLLCPCGIGRRFRACHRDRVNVLRDRIPLAVRMRALDILVKDLEMAAAKAHTPG